MSELADKLAYTEQPQYGYITNEPGVVDDTFNILLPLAGIGFMGSRGLRPVVGAKDYIKKIFRSANQIKPYLGEIWEGRDLYLRKPYDWMSKQERNSYANKGVEFFKKHFVDNPVSTILGDVDFHGNRAAETNPRYMNQYPFVRYNLSKADKNIQVPNYKPELRNNTEKFDNLVVDMFGDKYVYQVRNNKNNTTNDFYNINKYDSFLNNLEKLKQNPELYQRFLDMNKIDP